LLGAPTTTNKKKPQCPLTRPSAFCGRRKLHLADDCSGARSFLPLPDQCSAAKMRDHTRGCSIIWIGRDLPPAHGEPRPRKGRHDASPVSRNQFPHVSIVIRNVDDAIFGGGSPGDGIPFEPLLPPPLLPPQGLFARGPIDSPVLITSKTYISTQLWRNKKHKRISRGATILWPWVSWPWHSKEKALLCTI
jgi:hypothetical protein